MSGIIVITGLERLPPAERWSKLIAPLATKLQDSGLGELVERSAFRQEFEQCGGVNATEVAIRLKNLNYGRLLVDQAIADARLNEADIRRPERWKSYHCDDYFDSSYCRSGYFDEVGQYWYLVPYDRVFEDEAIDFLEVGGAGFDGIRFGYRRDHQGFWAYPVDGEFVRVGDNVDSFLKGYLSGTIRVG